MLGVMGGPQSHDGVPHSPTRGTAGGHRSDVLDRLLPGSLARQLALLLPAELLLIAWAAHTGADAATPLLTAITMSAALLTGWLVLTATPAPGQLLWVPGMQLASVVLDLHASALGLPGGAATWLALAAATSGAYLVLARGWLAARRAEIACGLAPGVGIGGAALRHPQADPRVIPLAVARFGPPSPAQVLLLHGLGASRAVWHDVAAELADAGIPGLAPDLLGFGGSRRIGTRFGLAEQVDALTALIDRDDGPPLVAVGHSFGCAVAVAFADARPERTRALVLVSPPVFHDATRARERLGQRGWLARQILADSTAATVACGLMCLLRPVAASAAARLAGGLPKQVARDSVEHSWPSYRDAMLTLLEANPLPKALAAPRRPTTVLVSDHDEQAPADDVAADLHPDVTLVTLAGDHLVPLNHPDAVVSAVLTAHLQNA